MKSIHYGASAICASILVLGTGLSSGCNNALQKNATGNITENTIKNLQGEKVNVRQKKLQFKDLVGAWVGMLPKKDGTALSDITAIVAIYSDGKAAFSLFEKNGTGFPIVGSGTIKNNILTIEPDEVHEKGGCKAMHLHIISASDQILSIDLKKSGEKVGVLRLKPASKEELKKYLNGKRPQ